MPIQLIICRLQRICSGWRLPNLGLKVPICPRAYSFREQSVVGAGGSANIEAIRRALFSCAVQNRRPQSRVAVSIIRSITGRVDAIVRFVEVHIHDRLQHGHCLRHCGPLLWREIEARKRQIYHLVDLRAVGCLPDRRINHIQHFPFLIQVPSLRM